MTTYRHTQRAPLAVLLYAVGAIMLAVAVLLPEVPPQRLILAVAGVVVIVAAASFHHLTVADEGDRLAVQFGPLPLFRRSVSYNDVQSVEVGRTSILDGWGIHLSLRGGWVWNLWGLDCVVLRLRKGIWRIGTDDAENLAQFLKNKVAA